MPAPLPPHHRQLCDAIARGRLALAEVAAIPPRELDAIYELAAQCLDVGRDAEAVDLYAGLTTLFPFSARYWRAYAIALHRRLLLERAHAAYEAALVLEPGHLWTRCYRAEVLIYLGQTDAARAELTALRQCSDREVGARANELLGQIDRLRAWAPPAAPGEPEISSGPAADTPTFTTDGRQPLPLAESEFTEPAPMREETTLTARVFLSPLPAETTEPLPKPAPREPSYTATAIVRRRRPVDELPIVTGEAEITTTALLPARADALEPTHTAVVLRRLGIALTEAQFHDDESTELIDRRRG